MIKWLCLLLVVLVSWTAPSHAALNNIGPSQGSGSQFSSNIISAPLYTDAIVLTGSASQTQTIPSGSNWVVFSAACNFFAATGGTAAVPNATTTTGAAAMQNPAAWNLQGTGATQITVNSSVSCIITLSFFQ